MKKSDIKYIKFKDRKMSVIILQNWLLDKSVSNAGLISLGINRACWDFIRKIENTPLSEELLEYKTLCQKKKPSQ